jgi:hypothetical protein
MELGIITALLSALFSLKGLFVLALGVAVGYVLRKYVEKKWPNEAALLDAVGTRYGEAAQAKLQEFKNKVSGG